MSVPDRQQVLLTVTLQVAVPLEVERMRGWSPEELEAARADLRDLIHQGADAMQFGGASAGAALTRWAQALALLALVAEGGVDFAGLHWCAVPGCRARSRYEHADLSTLEPALVPPPRLRPVVDLPLPDVIRLPEEAR